MLLAVSCTDSPLTSAEIDKRIQSRDFSVYQELQECSCDELEEQASGYYLGDSLFTGSCYLNYPNIDARYEVRQIYKGKLHGKRIILSPQGDTLTQNEYKNGIVLRKDVGIKEKCRCDELKEVKLANGSTVAHYFDEPFTGICERYFPAPNEDKVYLESAYKNGLLHGKIKIYNKNGDLILTENYVHGEKID